MLHCDAEKRESNNIEFLKTSFINQATNSINNPQFFISFQLRCGTFVSNGLTNFIKYLQGHGQTSVLHD